MDEKPDDNPYRAPQTRSPVARREFTPNLWIGVVCVALQIVSIQIAKFLPVNWWTVYVIGYVLGLASCLLFVAIVRRLRARQLAISNGQ